MSQVFCHTIPSIPVRRLKVGTATIVTMTADMRVIWADTSVDTILRGKKTIAFDQTADDWLICTVKGSGLLTPIGYSGLSTVFTTLAGDGAILFWSTWGDLLLWQQ